MLATKVLQSCCGVPLGFIFTGRTVWLLEGLLAAGLGIIWKEHHGGSFEICQCSRILSNVDCLELYVQIEHKILHQTDLILSPCSEMNLKVALQAPWVDNNTIFKMWECCRAQGKRVFVKTSMEALFQNNDEIIIHSACKYLPIFSLLHALIILVFSIRGYLSTARTRGCRCSFWKRLSKWNFGKLLPWHAEARRDETQR